MKDPRRTTSDPSNEKDTAPASDSSGGSGGGGSDPLQPLRARIDQLDRELVRILSERAQIVVEVGNVKRGSGSPTYAPHREQAVIRRAIAMNQGPLSARTIEAIFRELMSGSFTLELALRVG